VVIDQTNIVRKITVPDQSVVWLSDIVGDAPDLFEIQRSQPVTPIRRSS
jgi:hypothetical protein